MVLYEEPLDDNIIRGAIDAISKADLVINDSIGKVLGKVID